MAKLTWGHLGERYFEVGVDRGVLYTRTDPGVAWAGLISVNESPTGGDATPYYQDGIKYQDRGAPEEFSGTIEAYAYPPEFAKCDGTTSLLSGLLATQQYRQPFGFSYRTKVGNDLKGVDYGYKIHIVYNAKATPTERGNSTIKDTPETMTFSWGFTTIPVSIPGLRPTAHLIIDSALTDPTILEAIEALLYGTSNSDPSLPTVQDLIDIYSVGGPVPPFIVNTPDSSGVFTVSGPDFEVMQLDVDHFQLSADTVTDLGNGSYTASSE